MSNRDSKIRDRIAENDVQVMRSYLEVDVAEWLSDNEIPFAYEGFTIPSIVGPDKDKWEQIVDAVRAIGEGERADVALPNGEVMDSFDILNTWNDIYEKHMLMDEQISIPPRESLAGFDKRMMLPDFALYLDADQTRAGDEFDWGDYDYLVEVSGLYGVGLPDEAGEGEWWDWYRVSAVAFKELAYKLLGLHDKVYWVLPNQPYIEGISDGIPKPLRADPKYTIMNTTQAGVRLDNLAHALEVDGARPDRGLSPAITPTKYKRPVNSTGEYPRGSITPIQYTFDGIEMENVSVNERTMIAEDDTIVYYGDLGEVYIQEDRVHVRESQWRNNNMIMLREYVLDALSELSHAGIIRNLREE